MRPGDGSGAGIRKKCVFSGVGVVEMNWCERERRFSEGVSRSVEAVSGVWSGVFLEGRISVYILFCIFLKKNFLMQSMRFSFFVKTKVEKKKKRCSSRNDRPACRVRKKK